MKQLNEISWNVDEATYRSDPALSYSMLAQFAREGFKCVPFLKDKKVSQALINGSIVDCLVTEPETFKDRFFIADFNRPSITICTIVEDLFKLVNDKNEKYISLSCIPQELILEELNNYSYYPNWKAITRINKIIDDGSYYYKMLFIVLANEGKTFISTYEYNNANECKEVLFTSPFTKDIFNISKFNTNIKLHYQLKFKTKFNDYPEVRCMFDAIIVNHSEKIIIPIDLKTTGKNESEFQNSFISSNYYLQATLYTQILQKVISSDNYFKDFKIAPYKFIVINSDSLSPMIWEFPLNKYEGDFEDNYGNKYESWRKLAVKLNWHLETGITNYSYDAYNNKGVGYIECLKAII